jgi:hypothetical protein
VILPPVQFWMLDSTTQPAGLSVEPAGQAPRVHLMENVHFGGFVAPFSQAHPLVSSLDEVVGVQAGAAP